MRTPLIAGNWKMYMTVDSAVNMLQELLERLAGKAPENRSVLICPPFTAISAVAAILDGAGILWGGQDMYPADQGAFTGEISPIMLTDLGCTHVIVGHSERRHIIGEGDEFINRKVRSALSHDLVPILAVGEKIEQRRAGKEKAVVEEQLAKGLEGVEPADAARIVIAYEPIWARRPSPPMRRPCTPSFANGWPSATTRGSPTGSSFSTVAV